jgi:hypothetical protein
MQKIFIASNLPLAENGATGGSIIFAINDLLSLVGLPLPLVEIEEVDALFLRDAFLAGESFVPEGRPRLRVTFFGELTSIIIKFEIQKIYVMFF